MSQVTTPTQTATQPDLAATRCSTGVAGLDCILEGGLPSGCFYLVQGDPGSGKTTLALQFLLEGLRRGEKGSYVTLSETKEELLKVARSHGWSLAEIPLLELSSIESLLRPEAQTTVFHSSELELNQVNESVLEALRLNQPRRVVFDSLSEYRLMAETPLRYRRALLNLKKEFARTQSTVLLLDDKMGSDRLGTDPHVLSLTHGVIGMEQLSPDYGTSRRRLRVLKMRGVKFSEGYHDYIIETGRAESVPTVDCRRTPRHLPDGARVERVSRAGWFVRRRPGPRDHHADFRAGGHGKSTLALQYTVQAAIRGERIHGVYFRRNAWPGAGTRAAVGLET